MLTNFISVLLPLADSPISTVNGRILRSSTFFNGPIFLIVIVSFINHHIRSFTNHQAYLKQRSTMSVPCQDAAHILQRYKDIWEYARNWKKFYSIWYFQWGICGIIQRWKQIKKHKNALTQCRKIAKMHSLSAFLLSLHSKYNKWATWNRNYSF